MKRILLPLAVAGVLLAPSAAWATGTHTQPPRTPEKPCQCCEDLSLLWGPRIENHETRIAQLEQRLEQTRNENAELRNLAQNTLNWVNEINLNVTLITNRVNALSCQSDRIYEYRVRTEVDGSPVVGIAPRVRTDAGEVGGVEVMGDSVTQAEDSDRGSWRVNSEGRIVITASYQGVEAPKGQVRTVVAYLLTADGRRWRTKQALRLCLDDDGNMQDRTTQGRADD